MFTCITLLLLTDINIKNEQVPMQTRKTYCIKLKKLTLCMINRIGIHK